jgi:hypothetical protein
MARDSGSCFLLAINKDGMTGSLPKEFATLLGKVAQELAALHAPASDPHRNTFSSRVSSICPSQFAIGLENQSKGLPKVAPGLGKGATLGIRPWDFFHIGHVPSPALLNYCCELPLHVNPSLFILACEVVSRGVSSRRGARKILGR